jgi:hypothetical protein
LEQFELAARAPVEEAMMGDRSPKSKQRDQKQKDAAKAKEKTKKQDLTAVGRANVAGNKK